MLGSVPAEENHSSIIAFLGKGNSGWSVMYHLAALLNRQAEHSKVKKREEDRLHVSTLKYISKESGQAGLEDTQAKKSLSVFAYSTLYVEAAKKSLNLQSYKEDDGSTTIWSVGKEKQVSNTTIIPLDGRCPYTNRTVYKCQCCHEIVADKKLFMNKYDPKWLNIHKYLEMYPNLSSMNIPVMPNPNDFELMDDIVVISDKNSNDGNIHYSNDPECAVDAFVEDIEHGEDGKHAKISYQQLMVQLGELARTVQNNQSHCVTVMSDINKMIQHYRNGHDFQVNFMTYNDNIQENCASSSRTEVNVNDPIPAVTRVLPSASRQNRKKSRIEWNRSRSSAVSTSRETEPISQNSRQSDVEHLSGRRTKTRTCELCRQKGHGQFKCPSALQYGASTLAKNDLDVRQILATNMSQRFGFKTLIRMEDDDRQVMKSMPCIKIPALIIHKRYLIDNNLVDTNVPENLCVECTFLQVGGEENKLFTKTLFKVRDVATYLTRGRSQVIVSLLHKV